MDSICIRKYRHGDHESVNRIFSDGIRGQVINGICHNILKPNVIFYIIFVAYIFSFLFYGSMYSFYNGFISILFGVGIYSLSVYLSFMGYVW